MLHNNGPGPAIKKPAAAAMKCAETETLPNVPAGHAELRTDNSAAMIDGASDGTKGAHSLSDREIYRTCA